MRIGVLTGGGDCPGLNAVIRAVVRKGVGVYGHEFVGFRDGWKGPLENITMPLGVPEVRGILPRGGTILGSSRTNPFKVDDGFERITDDAARDRRRRADRDRRRGHPRRRDQARRARRQRRRRAEDDRQRPQRDRLHVRLRHRGQHRDGGDRPAAHHRRVAPPRADRRGDGPARRLDRAARRAGRRRERHPDPRAAVLARAGLRLRREPVPVALRADPRGRRGRDARRRRERHASTRASTRSGTSRLGGIGEWLAGEIEKRTGKEARTTVLGHIQRGGTPSAFDRVLATRFGLHAVDAAHDGAWGQMVALRGTDIVRVPLTEATAAAEDGPARAVRRGRGLLRLSDRVRRIWA